jgi:translocation and assembly module TamB
MRRALKICAWAFVGAAALALVLAGAVLVAGNTTGGRVLIERLTDRLTAGHVKLSALGGTFPADLTLGRLQLVDSRGVWLTAERVAVRWSPMALLERRIQVESLQVARLDIERAPQSEQSGGSASIPHIEVAQFSVEVLTLGAELAGRPATLSARGGARMRSLEDASAHVVVHRVDSEGEYTLQLQMDPARIEATLDLREPASGPLENILQLPGLGALSATLSIRGPRSAAHLEALLSAGNLRARAEGSVDLPQQAADLNFSLEAPAMSPRAEVAWQRLELQGRWRGSVAAPSAEGRLEVDGLQLAGGTAIATLSANLAASGATLAASGVINGLTIPGPQAKLFAGDPLEVDAAMRLDEAARPLVLVARHRLLSVEAQAVTAGQLGATLEINLADLAPFALIAGQDLRGDATIKARLARIGAAVNVTIDGGIGIAGGKSELVPLLGNHVALQISGALSDQSISLERVRLAGRAFTFNGSGSATHSGAGAMPGLRTLQARWDLNIADLRIIAPELGGTLQASGRLDGPPSSLAGDAELTGALSIRGAPMGTVSAELHARGLPAAPIGTVRAHGIVDAAPLTLDVALERGAHDSLRAVIHQAEWKSAHAEGELDIGHSLADSRGQLRLRLAQLSDLDRVVGAHLEGSLEGSAALAPAAGHPHAQFQLDARDLTAGQFSGNVQLSGEGVANAVAVHLAVQVPKVQGEPASLNSSGLLNLDTHVLRVERAAARYHGEELRLLSPAQVSYADGLSVSQVKLGAEGAVLQVEGELSPALDIRASLNGVKPKLVNVFVPGLLAEGTVEGQLRLQGSLAAPTGAVSISANGLRSASDEATGLPALDVRAGAELSGNAAAIGASLSSGSISLLTVAGSAPLSADGALDLTILGKLDVGLANPLLEARGMHGGGQLTVDAAVGGSAAAPQIRGEITLAEGNWRDYVHGANLTHISATVSGSEETLQIKNFTASAASGTVTMSGSIGVLQPGLPLDLKITATNAQPIESSVITANLKADIHVSGRVRERIEVEGKIHVNRAAVGIPDSLPPEVAVLDVRRRGQRAPSQQGKLVIGLDVTIQAPRQILVQGRGLDAELGGALHIGGTLNAPLVTGGFELQRGSFTIAGTKLTLQTIPPGRVSFDNAGLANKIDPSLDFTAQAVLTDATVTVHIGGYADSPHFEFTSNPPGMPQDEIMSRLLFGVPAAQLTALQVAEIGAALATLTGAGSGSNPLVKLQKSLGLDRLSVGANTTTGPTGAPESSGAAIAAGRYVSKRVYVEAKQTTTGASQVQVDVDLTKHLKLQTRLGNSTGTVTQGTTPENDPGSSVGISYQIEY